MLSRGRDTKKAAYSFSLERTLYGNGELSPPIFTMERGVAYFHPLEEGVCMCHGGIGLRRSSPVL